MKQSDLKKAYELSERLEALESNILLMDIKDLVNIRVEDMPAVPISNKRVKTVLELEIVNITAELTALGVKEFDCE